MPDTDIAAAARRVAEDYREGNRPSPDDLFALLPVLDAVGAEPGEDRVEYYARGIAAASCGDDERWREFDTEALAAIALADTERAAG